VGTRTLLVSHEATRTGAPRVAIAVAQALEQAGHSVVIVLRIGGPLASEFKSVAHRVVREPWTRLRVLLRYFRRTRPLAVRLEHRAARRVLRRELPGVTYLNTVKAACYVRPAIELGIPVVLHVHEVEPLLSTTLARYALQDHLDRIQLVACSRAAADTVSSVTGVPRAAITVVTSPVDVEDVVARSRKESVRQDLDGETVVGACGTADHRKGVDLWVEMVAHLRSARPDLAPVYRWLGRAIDPEIRRLAMRLGVADRIQFLGELENPYPAIAAMDVFTAPSRADAFPLVVLEAMALARPVVAFSVPGIVDQVGDAGVLVPPEEPRAMADAVARLLDDPERRKAFGARGAARVRAHFGLGPFRDEVARIVEQAVADGVGPRPTNDN
jgi:glycosyltransferase involved in cell wall biosynthesis